MVRRWPVALFFGLTIACTQGRTKDSSSPSTGGDDSNGDSCAGDPSSDANDGGTASGGDPNRPTTEFPALPPLAAVNDGNFATSIICADCHSNAPSATAMRDEMGAEVAPHNLWQGTMMANSARDPFWWAMVKAEAAATPSRAHDIEAECTRCHAPMAAIRDDLYGGGLSLDALLDAANPRAHLGLDGVACAACHQIPPTDVLGPPPLPATGHIYGPHAAPFTMPMVGRTGFTPIASGHMDESALCGTCHTLHTDPLMADGTALGGHFSEQAPYLEWRNSAYSTEGTPGPAAASCQSCHMPSTATSGMALATKIARRPFGDDFPPLGARSPFHRHMIVGGNTVVPAILRDFADRLHPGATAEAFNATIAASRNLLATQTARLSIQGQTRQDDTLIIPVVIESMVGHKLPSGIPARRVILQLQVRDGNGTLIFRSGTTNEGGQLVDRNDQVLDIEQPGSPIEPHHSHISDDQQVQIYESVLGDGTGAPVYRLLRAQQYAKDNRILPRGWQTRVNLEIAPVLGDADDDFRAGTDAVMYEISAPPQGGPYDITATLVYQAIGARFAAELFTVDVPEVRAFAGFWAASNRKPEVIATASARLP